MNKKNLKKLNLKLSLSPDLRIFFFDESRFGTHSKLGHGWFEKGSRTSIPVKLGFKNFYLYSSVEPLSGDSCTLLLPKVNTQCMNIFLDEMSHLYNGQKIALVMDGAGWHKSKSMRLPENIEIIYLPPYSPELNPVEKLWQYIKTNTIRNRIYESIEHLKDTICSFVSGLPNADLKSVCSCRYLYN